MVKMGNLKMWECQTGKCITHLHLATEYRPPWSSPWFVRFVYSTYAAEGEAAQDCCCCRQEHAPLVFGVSPLQPSEANVARPCLAGAAIAQARFGKKLLR